MAIVEEEGVAVVASRSSSSSANATFPIPKRATEKSPKATVASKRILSRDQEKPSRQMEKFDILAKEPGLVEE